MSYNFGMGKNAITDLDPEILKYFILQRFCLFKVATTHRKKQLQSSSISKFAGKKIVASYLIKWSNGEKRQEEEAEVVAATQKRKMLCKTRRANLVITVCRSLSQSI